MNLFDEYINRVNVTFNMFLSQMVNNCIAEEEIHIALDNLIKFHNKVLSVYELVNDDIKDKYYAKLNDNAKTLYVMIKSYNDIACSSISILQAPIDMDDDKKIDISNTLIGLTNSGIVDLFKVNHYKEDVYIYGRYNKYAYNEGDIYQGITTDELAIKRSHVLFNEVDCWASSKSGQMSKNRIYHVTVDGVKLLSNYENIREEMYKQKKQIIPYMDDNQASYDELLKVLAYTSELIHPDKSKQKVL